ncbi:MAG: putative ATP-dependent DNA helicase [Prokaryotic dsDNA virus sp.]|nr:MAG: putative ATP-dependent DNA helicase [Prokaryotic dsDNA virus sp.]|tara:strand:- start:2448 stop:3665 length:1218 start_codon:yes stop_codon:yes gene_type:complete
MKPNIGRTNRQIEGLRKWRASNFKGIAQYPTGFGKTFTALMAIKGMVKKANIKSVLVIVPTIELKKQWEQELSKSKIKIAEVLVINTAIKHQHNVDFLILDEIHRYAADTFRKIFEKASYKFIMGLTATLEREDGFHTIILQYLSVFDEISVNEALDEGWISPYRVYNVAVNLTSEELLLYKKADNSFKHFAAQLGRGAEAFRTAQEWIKSDNKQLAGQAAAYYNSMRSRKKVCLNNSNKINAVKSIVDLFPEKNGLIFSATTEFADSLQDKLGDISMTFHSKLKKKEQTEVIKRFKDKRTKVRFLSSVQALNEGFNVPHCSIGIIAGSNSTKRTMIQQLGRVVRYQDGKHAVIVNLYSPNTQEEKWMRKRLLDIHPSLITDLTLSEFINQFKIQETCETKLFDS